MSPSIWKRQGGDRFLVVSRTGVDGDEAGWEAEREGGADVGVGTSDSRVRVLMIPTEKELMVAREPRRVPGGVNPLS